MTDDKRFTTVELPKPTQWGIWYDGAYLSTYQVCTLLNEYVDVKKENEELKSTIKEVTELLSDEVDLFSDEATEHDINAYMELKLFDNKDAFYMATATKKAIRMLKELQRND